MLLLESRQATRKGENNTIWSAIASIYQLSCLPHFQVSTATLFVHVGKKPADQHGMKIWQWRLGTRHIHVATHSDYFSNILSSTLQAQNYIVGARACKNRQYQYFCSQLCTPLHIGNKYRHISYLQVRI